MGLELKELVVKIDDKLILNGFNINIKPGEIHAIMGRNGVGKSTVSKVIMGDSHYTIVSGDILYNSESILKLTTDQRSRLGLFLGMQLPTEIDGVSNQDFLRTALSIKQGKNVGLYDFIVKCEKNLTELKMNKEMIHRPINVGFSGGEKKKNEILQIKILEPSTIILDEIDSGLDVDSLKVVCDNIVDYLKTKDHQVGVLIITHYPRILEYLKPDYVHIMMDGKIIKTGDYNLAVAIEKNGYNNIQDGMTEIINGNSKNE